MRKASKLISLLLTAAMAGTLLAGCGNSGSSGSGSVPQEQPLILRHRRRYRRKEDWTLRRKWSW